MFATTQPRRPTADLSSEARPARRQPTVVGVITVVAVEAALVALFLLGWTTAEPSPGAPLAAPAPVVSVED